MEPTLTLLRFQNSDLPCMVVELDFVGQRRDKSAIIMLVRI